MRRSMASRSLPALDSCPTVNLVGAYFRAPFMSLYPARRQLLLPTALTRSKCYRAGVVASRSLLPAVADQGGHDGKEDHRCNQRRAPPSNRRTVSSKREKREASNSRRVRGADGVPPQARDSGSEGRVSGRGDRNATTTPTPVR